MLYTPKETDYRFARSRIRDGDILACEGYSSISKAIKFFENEKHLEILGKKTIISHVGIFAWWGEELFVIEAVDEGVVFRRFSEAYRDYDGDCYALDYPHRIQVPVCAFLNRARKLIGKKYDWKDIKQQAENKLPFLFEDHIEDDEWFCSELVNYCSHYFFGDVDEWVTPHYLSKQCKHWKYKLKRIGY